MCLADQENLNLHPEEFPLIWSILESTLQLDPDKRVLGSVIRLLAGRYVAGNPCPLSFHDVKLLLTQ